MRLGRTLRLITPLALILAGSLATAGAAEADTCEAATGTPGWHNPSTWSCGHVPTDGDSALIGGPTTTVLVSAAAETGDLIMGDGGTITFSNDVTLEAGTMTAGTATVQGAGTVTVAGAFTKANSGGLAVKNQGGENSGLPSADLILNGPATQTAGEICVAGNELVPASDRPSLQINDTFTIEDGTSVNPFSCSTSSTAGANIDVSSTGHLIKEGAGTKNSQSAIDNDGTFTVQGGELILIGGTGGSTSEGDYVADSGATLQFGSCCAEQYLIGASGSVGGDGAIDMSANPMTLAPGATLDPAVLNLVFGELVLNGSTPLTLSTVNLTGAPELDTDRPVTATNLNVTGAASIRGTASVTVPTGGSFTKTGGGNLTVSANASEAAADLILNVDATLAGGAICATRMDGGPADDQPHLHINQDFTIGAGADAAWFACGTFGPGVRVNGPDGHLTKTGPGTTTSNGIIEVAGGTVSIASGQTFSFNNTNAYQQTGGLTEIASGGALLGSPVLTGGALGGSGQVTGNLLNTSGTVRPGTSPGTLTVTGDYSQGANGVLEVDVSGTAQGTQFDHLSVGGAATLAGTAAVAKGAGFDPQLSDTFQFLSSASRSGTFSTLVGSLLASGEGYVLDYPGGPSFGARLTVTGTPGSVAQPTVSATHPDSPVNHNTADVSGTAPPGSTVAVYPTADCSGPPSAIGSAAEFAAPGLQAAVPDNSTTTFRGTATIGGDTSPCSATSAAYVENSSLGESVVVREDTSQSFLDSLLGVAGSLFMNNQPTRPTLVLPNLETVDGAMSVTGNTGVAEIDLGGVVSSGSVSVTGNAAVSTIELSSFSTASSDITIEANGSAEVELGALDDVGGDLTVESEGTGTFDPGSASPGGDTDLDTTGYDSVSGTTAAGSTTVANTRPEATMTTELPGGAFAAPVPFTITRVDPAILAPEQGTSGGAPVTVDPVAAYQFDFDVPTLNQDANLTFEIQMDGLDQATRDALIAAVNAGTATMATKGASGAYQAFPVCTGAQVPTADGCVLVEKLDSNGVPTTGTPAILRFSNVVGHFSAWAVAIVSPQSTTQPPGGTTPPPAAQPPKKCKKGFKKVKGKCKKRKKRKKR